MWVNVNTPIPLPTKGLRAGDSAFRLGRPAPEASPAVEAEPITSEAGLETRPPAFEEEITTQTEGENTA